mgnify:CR=1 FL=1
MRVLVVDDDTLVAQATAELLSMLGHEAVQALDGETAVQRCRADGKAVDCVFLDVRMPGMDGYQVLERLKTAAPEVKVVLMTGNPERVDPSKVRCHAVVGKPFGSGELKRVLACLDGGRPTAGESR